MSNLQPIPKKTIIANEIISYWSGKGADKYWTNPQNWSNQKLPTAEDSVIFDNSCSKDAVLNTRVQVKSLTITPDYTGTLSGWNELLASNNILIQGGTIQVNLKVGGNLTIEAGKVISYLSIEGNLTIENGMLKWVGGCIAGQTFLKGGRVVFASQYNSYYSFKGDFIHTDTTVCGQPIFKFLGNELQTFNAGSEGINLRDLYNFGQLILKGTITLKGFFFNCGTFALGKQARLNVLEVTYFSNRGVLVTADETVFDFEMQMLKAGSSQPVTLMTPDERTDEVELVA